MFILTILGQEYDGVYSVLNPNGDKIIYIFEEEDDAVRYAMMLEEENYPEMHVIEVEDEAIIKTCKQYEYNYTIITENDIVIPPKY